MMNTPRERTATYSVMCCCVIFSLNLWLQSYDGYRTVREAMSEINVIKMNKKQQRKLPTYNIFVGKSS